MNAQSHDILVVLKFPRSKFLSTEDADVNDGVTKALQIFCPKECTLYIYSSHYVVIFSSVYIVLHFANWKLQN